MIFSAELIFQISSMDLNEKGSVLFNILLHRYSVSCLKEIQSRVHHFFFFCTWIIYSNNVSIPTFVDRANQKDISFLLMNIFPSLRTNWMPTFFLYDNRFFRDSDEKKFHGKETRKGRQRSSGIFTMRNEVLGCNTREGDGRRIAKGNVAGIVVTQVGKRYDDPKRSAPSLVSLIRFHGGSFVPHATILPLVMKRARCNSECAVERRTDVFLYSFWYIFIQEKPKSAAGYED